MNPLPQADGAPESAAWEWQSQAACQGADRELFFHPPGERDPTRRRRAQAAKAVCAGCPVRRQCLHHSLHNREPYGVWGGVDEDERIALLSQLDRARRG